MTEAPSLPKGPAIILVEPQLGENIGMVARAMLNCGLTDLRLVHPRDGWPNPDAVAASADARVVIENTRVYQKTEHAIIGIAHLYATTARPRDMTKRVVTPRQAAAELVAQQAAGATSGLLFGREAKGLKNDDVVLADTVLTVPLNPEFTSLNLAQAVFCIAYEWFQAQDQTPASELNVPKATRPANKRELVGLFEHLEQALDDSGFLQITEKRPNMVRNLRNIWQRAQLTDQEVRTWRGIITALVRYKPPEN
ncbi:MAG: RNA methyltransferase [Rhodospirillales bacterium]|nr:RNA methyltransferase [Rhodospirillales bacterium]